MILNKIRPEIPAAIIAMFFLTSWKSDEQFCTWYMYFGNHRLSDRVGIHTEYQWRRMGLGESWKQSLLRLGLDYHPNARIVLTGGYGHIRTFQYGLQPSDYVFNEHRIWEQIFIKSLIGRLSMSHRLRIEQRFIERKVLQSNEEYSLSGFRYTNRIRYRIFTAVPLKVDHLTDNTAFIAFYDEIMFGFGGGMTGNFDQNRFYLGLGWNFTRNFNLQAGYLNQFIRKPDGLNPEQNHVLQIGLQYDIDLRKSAN